MGLEHIVCRQLTQDTPPPPKKNPTKQQKTKTQFSLTLEKNERPQSGVSLSKYTSLAEHPDSGLQSMFIR